MLLTSPIAATIRLYRVCYCTAGKRESAPALTSEMSVRLPADDDTLRDAFAKLTTFDDLAQLLDVPPRTLRYFLYRAKSYRRFEIRKKSGGVRTIYAPDNSLKIIQRKLNQVLQAVYRGRAPVHGFVRGKSIRSNAKRHLGCTALLNFDLVTSFLLFISVESKACSRGSRIRCRSPWRWRLHRSVVMTKCFRLAHLPLQSYRTCSALRWMHN